MRISELISYLETQMNDHGNLQVYADIMVKSGENASRLESVAFGSFVDTVSSTDEVYPKMQSSGERILHLVL